MNQPVNILTDRQIVKQSNILNTAQYSLGSLAFDIFNLFLAQIDKEDKDFKHFRIKISDIEKHFGRTVNIKYLDKATDEILKCIVKVKESDGTIKKRTLAYACDLIPKENLVEFKISDDMKNYLLGLKNHFVQNSYKETLKLNTFYSKRIYLLLMQFKYTGFLTVTLKELKFILDLEKNKSYEKYSQLKKRVLTPSLKQINEHSDYNVYMHEVKEGRKVTRLEFKFEKKEIIEVEEDFGKAIEDFISYFQSITDNKEKVTVDSKMRLKELLKEFSIEDFQKVALYFHKKWSNDPEFAKYVRVKTLYNDKFEERLMEADDFFMNYDRSSDLLEDLFKNYSDLIEKEAKVDNPFDLPLSLLEKILHWNKYYSKEEILTAIDTTIAQWSKDSKVAPHIKLSTILNAKFNERVATTKKPIKSHRSGVLAAEDWLRKVKSANNVA